jgi:hypothetical protein
MVNTTPSFPMCLDARAKTPAPRRSAIGLADTVNLLAIAHQSTSMTRANVLLPGVVTYVRVFVSN